jgi:Flp pilus assembly protein TadG
MSDNGMMRALCSRLWQRNDGASSIEFALIAMPFILTVVGIIEIAMILFADVLLEGALRDASRFGITGQLPASMTREEKIRAIVADRTMGLVDMEKVKVETLSYGTFTNIGKPEPFVDAPPLNGKYDVGESFTDVNGNAKWDADQGKAEAGGSGAIVVYRVSYDWPLLTGLLEPLLGSNGYVHLRVSTAVRNEPF